MAVASKTYPRAIVRRIIKGHTRKSIGKATDALVFLNYALFIEQLLDSATHKARGNGEKRIAAKDIRKVTLTTLRRFKG
ncbi:uncharacterized protein A1O9_12599 [Exophiala aquamarina CBS 119918]|uniref:Transcription factor CBF/NF-Y/archaeal histone domain-containing protein n=1 Tax=Exophiala aquamarina CBS 119918 TaxID=1182545 RepID=A0A072NTR1_9EURO|nr:uncharacterized protein A1O9_12599 [Exophiala aquamarina CBS 119918]KEF51249.1 hypothetical protein A1O9_12599 [Exophiala aquamarina CBS 119918]